MQPRLTSLKVEDLRTTNAGMTRCISLAKLAANSDVPIVLLGETGTGKTLLAQAIHNSSARAEGPFVSFNASAMSDTLLESQLFGHEKGAFTGAQQAVKGKFELANAGTIFLDEISDMSPLAQVKVLRVLEYGEFERLGSERMLKTDARIICATNVSLRERVRQGKFREDLYHRLNGLTILIPALRDRREELPGLIANELKATALTGLPCIKGRPMRVPSAALQTRTVRSRLAEARRRPSGLKDTPTTGPRWPRRVRIDWPVVRSQIRTVVSKLPEARRCPSGLKATATTRRSCPLRS